MINSRWTYKKPTKEGKYLVNLGDVVTPENTTSAELYKDDKDRLIMAFHDCQAINVYEIHKSYKFLYLDDLASEVDNLGNGE